MLKIDPQNAHKIYADEIAGRMRILGIPAVPMKRLQQFIDSPSGDAEKLVSWPEGISLSGGVEIIISKDKMQADMILHPPRVGGDDISAEDIYHALNAENVTTGIKKAVISSAVRNREYKKKIPVADGIAAENGCSKGIKYNFLIERRKPWQEMPYGRINLKELNYVQNVAAGEVIAEYIPAVPPRDGTDIFGNKIPAEQAESEQLPEPGENTKLDGERIIALETGNAVLEKGRIKVEPLLVVDSIDYETGNIKFNGTVEVRNSVADGFSVEASGDIIIGQCIGRISLASERDIVLAGGINGGGSGTCLAAGDVIARYIEGAVIKAEGSVVVEELVMHSHIKSNANVILKGKRAELIGGTVIAAGSLWCKKTGAANGTETVITLGIYPEAMEEFSKFKQKIIELEDSCSEKEMKLKVLSGRMQDADSDKILQAIKQLREEINTGQNEAEVCRRKSRELARYFSRNPGVIAIIENVINTGSMFRLGIHEYKVIQKPVFSAILCCENETIIQKGFNSAAPPELPEVPVFSDWNEYSKGEVSE